MIAKKLKFAPCWPGDGEGYRDLYKALADYHRQVAAARRK
jgi:hypothetical protein